MAAEGEFPKSDGDVLFASEINTTLNGMLGEVRMFALTMTNAITKANLQAKGWAICDGTTPAAQGIASPTITTTPDLRTKFLRHSANETTGGTGGLATNIHQWLKRISGGSHPEFAYSAITANNSNASKQSYDSSGAAKDILYSGTHMQDDLYTTSVDNQPPYYDICYFMKVKIV